MRAMLGAVLATAITLTVATAARASCQLQMYADLPLQPDAQRALVKGAVNSQPALFIIDTGAWSSTIPYATAVGFGVKVDGSGFAAADVDVETEGVGGRQRAGVARFDMQLGKIDLPREVMTALPMHPLDHHAAALIGMDLLAQHDLELDLPDNEIRLIKVDGCTPSQLAYWNKPYSQVGLVSDGSGRPAVLITVLLNGHAIPAEVDSGATQSTVTPEAARLAVVDLAQASEGGQMQGIGYGRLSSRIARFNTFTIGDETIKNANLVVSDMWKYNKLERTGTRLGSIAVTTAQPKMLLGADFLRVHRVLIANSMRMMVFSYMGGPVFDISNQSRPAPGQAASSQRQPPQH